MNKNMITNFKIFEYREDVYAWRDIYDYTYIKNLPEEQQKLYYASEFKLKDKVQRKMINRWYTITGVRISEINDTTFNYSYQLESDEYGYHVWVQKNNVIPEYKVNAKKYNL